MYQFKFWFFFMEICYFWYNGAENDKGNLTRISVFKKKHILKHDTTDDRSKS